MNDNNTTCINSLHELLHYDALQFSNAEVQLKDNLTRWIDMAASLKLKMVLLRYQDYVQEHIQKLESFFEHEEITPLTTCNRIIHAFAENIDEKSACCTEATIRDACLLAGIQAIIHFKISGYGTAAAFARAVGMEKSADIFHEAEVNEKQIDDRLSQLAEHEINGRANTGIGSS